jgi:phosphopantothenate---cysteine ligase (CTP)
MQVRRLQAQPASPWRRFVAMSLQCVATHPRFRYFAGMRCIVTAGPTYEPLDRVRRITNFSTGRLGCELANFLAAKGHHVDLLLGEQATYCGEHKAQTVARFGTTRDLRDQLNALAKNEINAVFHAAAVSDFTFGKTWLRSETGELSEVKSGKIGTRLGTLLTELVPTPKIISELRHWFPQAKLIGWKYEVDGSSEDVIRAGKRQLTESKTDICVLNGPAYGPGFGLLSADGACAHIADVRGFYEALHRVAT